MLKLTFLSVFVAYLWVGTLFDQTSHRASNGNHTFGYSAVGTVYGLGANLIPAGAAWYLWRWERDRVGAGIFLFGILLIAAFVMPQLFMQRTVVTGTHLVHRREPPHTRYDADVAFEDIAFASKLREANGMTGYRLTLKDGRILELPSNTVLTAASDVIDEHFRVRDVPLTIVDVVRKAR